MKIRYQGSGADHAKRLQELVINVSSCQTALCMLCLHIGRQMSINVEVPG